jgi:signal transduction histidine kinase
MQARPITQRYILLVLIAGFGFVFLLLVAAAVVGVSNIQSIQENAAALVREQAVANRLIDQLHAQEISLSEVFSLLARDPDSVDADSIARQLDAASRDIARIAGQGARTPERAVWERLRASSEHFSEVTQRLLDQTEPETFASLDLFRAHEAFLSVVARLIESEYRKVAAAQAQIDRRSSRLLDISLLIAGGSVLLALIFAALTVRLVLRLSRRMEWQTAELARVSWHMLEDQEATARRFSHELHDELGQSLTAVKANLSSIALGVAPAPERIRDSIHLVDEAIGNVRQMSQLLRPTILDDFGLEAGLRWLCEGFATRTGIDVKLNSHFSGRLPDQMETHLFRIAQEALTNVARHAEARQVTVTLDSPPGWIRLTLEDNGKGMQLDGSRTGLGLTGMRARAREAGGSLTVRAATGSGVVIEARVPQNYEADSNPAG